MDLASVGRLFDIQGEFISAENLGNGNINETFLVTYKEEKISRYVFQKINHKVFTKPGELMENYSRVCEHIKKKLTTSGEEPSNRSVDIVLTKTQKKYFGVEDGNYWRCCKYLEDTTSYEIVENFNQAKEAAKTFGVFLKNVSDLPGERLHETIPDFHNTPKRVMALEKAAKENPYGRLKNVEAEMKYILERKEEAGLLQHLLEKGELTERIIHNDTKLNNVLIDIKTGKGVCVIDLDTVMPGLVQHDFGDMVRSGAASANENETDLSKVYMKFDMYRAILHGFLEKTSPFLTPLDVELLPLSAKIITLETGIRFLTDYLMGDKYFKIRYPLENLDRSRMQLKLVQSMEEQMEMMQDELKKVICYE